jgi:transcriptional regulator with XRE-family HTH domain
MIIGKKVKYILKNGQFVIPKSQVNLSPGETLKILRELKNLSQNELANLSGIAQSTISAIEIGRINLGVERSKILAKALNVHPAVILFSGWDCESNAS